MRYTDYTDSILIPQIYFSFSPPGRGGGLRWGCFRYSNFEIRYCLVFRISNLGFFKSTAGCLL